jgi:2-polyprenyl-6-methoxyphenol hydroxylase-like FAD-dependent oxidoreductase
MTQKIPVLIVGGGPVGLALAAELGWRGIACMLIERTDGAIKTPKMNEVNTRSMEFCRRWGIADQVFNCPFPVDYPLDVSFMTSMSGHELARVRRPARADAQPEPHSPVRFQACSQIWFDPMLQKLVRSFPSATLCYRQQLESFVPSADGVTATVIDLTSGARHTVEADYLVGCDGAASLVRQSLGIAMVGPGTIGYPLNLFFRTPDLVKEFGRDPATFYIPVDQEGMWGNLRVIDPVNGLWRLMIDDTGGKVTADNVDQVDRDFYLRRALGRDFKVEWVDTSVWHRRSLVAERYGDGRVFLAGDAVHQLSPTGALGMNSGLGDAVDLGWKLAAVLGGWGGERLLASYDLERRPIGDRNVRMATGFYRANESFRHGDADLAADNEKGAAMRRRAGEVLEREIGREFRTIGLQLGYRYEASPICVPDGTPEPPDTAETYEPTARPGSRAPHVWLTDGRSILDLFGAGFVLLRFPGAPDGGALARAAAARGVPLAVADIAEPEAASLYQQRMVLVRPDGHVAWRGDVTPADPVALIDRVRGAR